jgi:NAD(P)H-hydrate epimerase
MIIYRSQDIRDWDAFTISNEPVASVDLMERAAQALCTWVTSQFSNEVPVVFFCGKGNNGGDGLALARLLHSKGYACTIIIVGAQPGSPDFIENLHRLLPIGLAVMEFDEMNPPSLDAAALVVDAIFGTGINRAPSGIYAAAIQFINQLPNQKVAVDLPSGMYADAFTDHEWVVHALYTCTFQCLKPAMLMAENEKYTGQWTVLDIGLNPAFVAQNPPTMFLVDDPGEFVALKQLSAFAHKGNRGHALLGVGSANMMGAAVLAAKAALRSGAGLVTIATDSAGWPVIQTAAPEAMCAARSSLVNDSYQQQRRIKAIGVGCGWMPDDDHLQQLACLIEQSTLPLVIDATALALLAEMPAALAHALNPGRILLTPHVGEFDRLFGSSQNNFERLEKARNAARQYQCYIMLKGAYSRLVTPDGMVYFNATGNNGMAKGGSGDVLTGLLTGLLAQGYPVKEAAMLGVWLHGKAGDIAAERYTANGMTAGSLIECLPSAWERAV